MERTHRKFDIRKNKKRDNKRPLLLGKIYDS